METSLHHSFELLVRDIGNASLLYHFIIIFVLANDELSLLPVNCGKEMEVAFVCLFNIDIGNGVAVDNPFWCSRGFFPFAP